jgi:hypothetical protein
VWQNELAGKFFHESPESEATTNMGERRNDGRRWFESPKDKILAGNQIYSTSIKERD